MIDQDLIDNTYKEIIYGNEPLGQIRNPYPGAKPEYNDIDYVTNLPLSFYNSKLQQQVENAIREENEESTMPDPDDMSVDITRDGKDDFSISEIGRIYELKKIFARLISLETFLSSTTDEVLVRLSSYVRESTELFKLVIDNIDSFMDEIDNIIILFYEFLKVSYKLLHLYYNKLKKDSDSDS
jgi:hypothetical protein